VGENQKSHQHLLVGGLEHEWILTFHILGFMDYSGLMDFNGFFHILGISSSQLTFTPSFFRGIGQPPTSLCPSKASFGKWL
jgi:Na+/H+ antiporter NhaD/arsenite permease-like protein